ncbi:MAG: hypothetical protein ACRDN9_13425 [Streptosporangiaceae bacterium]
MLADVTGPERRLLDAVGTGSPLDLRVGVPELDDPAQGPAWDAARTLRAELLVELLTGARDPDIGRRRVVNVRGARIVGSLDLEGCVLVCPLLLWDCSVEQPVNLNEATAPGIRLTGCHVPGLFAEHVRTTGNLRLDRLAARGEIRLLGSRIDGGLALDGAHVSNPGGRALHGDLLTVGQLLSCRGGFTAEGEVRLVGARIGGQLILNGARLVNPSGRALMAYGLTVDQAATFLEGFSAEGEVHLVGGHVAGQLDLEGARLANSGGAALNADALTVGQDMMCRHGFSAEGEVRLMGARIGGYLDLTGAYLTNPAGVALRAGMVAVDRAMLLRGGFTAEGEVRLAGASVGVSLELIGALLTSRTGVALAAESLTVGLAMFLLPGRPPEGAVDLTNARVGAFRDDPATWPATLHLRGFVYETLENEQVGVRARLRWLRRHPGGYAPQLYDQLAAAYRRAGREEAARRVAISKHWYRGRQLGALGRLWNRLLYMTVGYGYRTWLAAVWLAGLTVAGSWGFALAHPAHMIPVTSSAPEFNPVGYTLDVLLPIVDLGQQQAWQPQGAALYWSWVLIGVGWALTTAVVAGVTNVLRRT